MRTSAATGSLLQARVVVALSVAAAVVLAGSLLTACTSHPGPLASLKERGTRAAHRTSLPSATTLAYLTAFGATTAAWAANHTPDPRGTGGYWPRLADGEDTYTDLLVVGGRVVGYEENLDPALPLEEALAVAGDEMPVDASVVKVEGLARSPLRGTGTGCEMALFDSPTLEAVLHARALVEFFSSTDIFDAGAVSRITYKALPAHASLPVACSWAQKVPGS